MAETNFPFMCFHSDLIRCLSQDDGMERFDKIVDKIEDTLYDPLSARNHTCSDFNSQPKEWLSHLNKTDEGRYWHDFIIYELPQIANHLDLFLTSDPEKNSPQKCYLSWTLKTIHWSILMPCQRYSLMSHFIGQYFGIPKLTGIASNLTLQKLIFNFPNCLVC